MSDSHALGVPERRLRKLRVFGLGATIALLAAIGFGAWIYVDHHNNSQSSTVRRAKAVAATREDLVNLATRVKHPVYWAGPIAGDTYELTKTNDGRIYVRYLPSGVAIGDPNPKYTTVGTYPDATAYSTLSASATRAGAKSYNTQSGALVVTNTKTPTSVYFAFKGTPYLVEVFDPSATKALQLVLSGQIKLIS